MNDLSSIFSFIDNYYPLKVSQYTMFELQQQNERVLESALSEKRKKMKELDRALREVDVELNQAEVRFYRYNYKYYMLTLVICRSKSLFSITTRTSRRKLRASWIWTRWAKCSHLFVWKLLAW